MGIFKKKPPENRPAKEEQQQHTHSFTRVLGIRYDEKGKKHVIYGCSECPAESS